MEAGTGVCPFCGVRSDVNLRDIPYHDLESRGTLPCPDCQTPLAAIELDTGPNIQIERCPTCFGLFFNPGELEMVLNQSTNPFVRLDRQQLKEIATDYGFHHEVVYLKCPLCAERMSHINFGGSSGVILDLCGTHGVWLQNTELRRLMEWWHAGGKLIYEQNQEEQVRFLSTTTHKKPTPPGLSPAEKTWEGIKPAGDSAGTGLVSIIAGLAALLFD
jgi:Zn-finger nucleic acid-binding protein